MYTLLFTKKAVKDIKELNSRERIRIKQMLTELIAQNPYVGNALVGDLSGNYSYRVLVNDRIIYSIDEENKTIYIKRAGVK
jgi:toxin YoeB